MDAVGVHQFTVVEAVQQVAVILFEHVFARAVFVVGLLYAAPCGGVVACHGEAYHRAVGQVDGALHESLAEGAAADDYAAVPVLDGSGDDFAGRGRVFVYQYDEASVGEASVALCQEVASPFGASFGVDNEFFLSQELVGQVDGGVEVASAVALQVEDEVFHALCLEFLQGLGKFIARGGGKAVDAYVSRAGLYDVGGIEAEDGYLVALHGEGQRVCHAAAHDGEVHLRAFGAAEALHDVIGAHLDAGNGGIVHRRDAVARQDAYFFRGSSADGLDDQQGVFYHLELDADAVEVALQRFVHGFHFFGVVVRRVRVQLGQHLDDGAFHHPVLVHGVYVQAADGELGHLEFAQGHVALCPGLSREEEGQQEGGKGCDVSFSFHEVICFYIVQEFLGGC